MSFSKTTLSLALPAALMLLTGFQAQGAGVSGAIFTTVADGSIVNANQYSSKCAVYLDGGPGPHAPAKAAGLPDGDYYFQVTDPSGQALLSTDPVSNRRFHVTGGLITAYTGTGGPAHATGIDQDHGAQGAITIQMANVNCPTDFLNTPNPGNTYKAWATPVGSFVGDPAQVDNTCGNGCSHGFVASQSKTDNFKALPAPTASFSLTIQKQFFDGYGTYNSITGWTVHITDPLGVTNTYTTDSVSGSVVLNQLPGGTYTVTEDPAGGPAPSGCGLHNPSPYQTLLNSVLQPTAGTTTFTWTTTSPVNVTFVNRIDCTF